MEEKKKNPHAGHRKRMKERFLKHGLENFDDHNLLELLMFFSVARGDLNPTAHRLMEHFGRLSAVFDAPIEELMKVKGVGENTALLLKLVSAVNRRYMRSLNQSMERKTIVDPQQAGRYLLPYFMGERDELVYMLCLDAASKLIDCRLLSHGGLNAAQVDVRKIVEIALLNNATSVILAHNHTSGVALPSKADREVTETIGAALSTVKITLADHIVICGDDFVSMTDSRMV